MSIPIIIGSRGSKLALWQAETTRSRLAQLGHSVQIEIIRTKGDKFKELSFDKIEGKGFFTKELEDALLSHQIDIAVHSMKDLPTTSPAGLAVAGVSGREDPADWLLLNPSAVATVRPLKMKKNVVIGTSSNRRASQLKYIFSDIEIRQLRGNVPTRINKLREGGFDGIVLAAAGIIRLQVPLDDLHVVKFSPREFVPAPAQGVLGFQIRAEDKELQKVVSRINDPDTEEIVSVEREILHQLGGSCQTPIGVYIEKDAWVNFHGWVSYASSAKAPLIRESFSSGTLYEFAGSLVEKVVLKKC